MEPLTVDSKYNTILFENQYFPFMMFLNRKFVLLCLVPGGRRPFMSRAHPRYNDLLNVQNLSSRRQVHVAARTALRHRSHRSRT